MKPSHEIVAWVFERLSLDAALAGDLAEEKARGRSPIWYWRQVLIAIWIGVWNTIFAHRVLAMSAVATGCAVNGVWLLLWKNFLHIGLPTKPDLSIEAIASLLIILLTQTVTGWIVARTHRAHSIPMVFAFAIWLVLWFFLDSFSEGKRLLVDSIDQPRFRPYLAWYLLPIAMEVIGLFCGGIVGSCPKRQSSSANNPETA